MNGRTRWVTIRRVSTVFASAIAACVLNQTVGAKVAAAKKDSLTVVVGGKTNGTAPGVTLVVSKPCVRLF